MQGEEMMLREALERRERELIERNSQFEAVLDAIPVAVIIADTTGRVVAVNRMVREIWGEDVLISERLEDYGVFEAWWPATGQRVQAHEWALARALERGERSGEEAVEIRTDAGERKTILNSALPIRSAGQIVGGVAVSVDITKRKRAEERLRFLAEAGRVFASSLEFEKTLEIVAHLCVPDFADWCFIYGLEPGDGVRPLAVVARDPAKEQRAREFEQRFPFTPDHPLVEVIRSGESLFLPTVSESFLEWGSRDAEHLRLLQEAGFRSLIVVPLHARGRTLGAIALSTAESGRIYDSADLGVAEDLARRAAVALDNARLYREAEEARGEAERRAREEAALRKATEAVTASYTAEEVIRRIAESALTATNADGAHVERIDIERGEVVIAATAGKWVPPIGSRTPFHGSYIQIVIERNELMQIARIESTDRPLPMGLRAACGSCSALVVPLIDAGEAIGALFLIRGPERCFFRPDELERAHTFANLAALAFRKVHLLEDSEQKREEIERVMESRARLMRGFSHDVKNPIGAADGYLQLLEEGIMDPLTARQEEGVERARRSIHSALRLINDLLELARAEAGSLKIELMATDPRDAVLEMAEEYRALAEEKGLSLSIEVPDVTPVILSDADRLRQIIGNLISNAVKYTARGGITVQLRVVEAGGAPGPGRWITLTVSDTGPGIPPEQQQLIFREFSRLGTSSASGGTGIGLAISQRIAEALGGRITLESDVGKGSTFALWLPLAEHAEEAGIEPRSTE